MFKTWWKNYKNQSINKKALLKKCFFILKILFILYNTNNILYHNFIMQSIIQYQYSLAEKFLEYIQNIQIPYFWIWMENFPLDKISWIVYITVFILSLVWWFIWRIFCRIFKTHVYNIEKYKWILLFNWFYIIPFVYWFFWWRFSVINIFLLFLWSWVYVWIDIFFNQPDRIIDFFN